jgi:SulP family sulfate permease
MKLNIAQLRTEILSGLTISIALVPEAISFALIVGVSAQFGLWAAVFMVLSTSLFGGRPGLISGATGATAVIMAGLVKTAGPEMLSLGVMVAGAIQFIIWMTGSWRVFELIPKPVISGFLTALAFLILIGQFKYFNIGSPSALTIILMICVSILCAVTMVLTKNNYLKIPPALISILIGIGIGLPLSLPTVGDLSQVSSNFPIFRIPEIKIESLILVLPYSFGMALAGLTESLLTVDSIANRLNEPGNKSKETFAQAIGNIISSMFGAIGGCVLVGQTNLNISSGARTRISSITAGLGLIIIILLLGGEISNVPLVGLIGIMFVVVYETGDYRSLIGSINLARLTTLITVIVSLLTHNLSIGIVVGSIVYYIGKLIT